MIKANEEEILRAFEAIHGEMGARFCAEVIYDEDANIVGVACLKDGHEAWRSTLTEMSFDLLADKSAFLTYLEIDKEKWYGLFD